MEKHRFLAACAFGLEAIVKRELISLGYDARVLQPGKVQFEGDWEAACKANLWLRTADRILLVVDEFPAGDFDQLFETTKAIDWSKYLPVDASFPVNGRSRNSKLTSVPAIQRSTKKAVVEGMTKAYGRSLDEDGPIYKIEVALLDDVAMLTIDTTGPSLHKRGYRKLVGEAPLKETLAAAMVLLSFWKSDRPLIDPFCGTGTIPIEAALIGKNIAPGLKRQFAAEGWSNFSMNWNELRLEAEQAISVDLQCEKLIGTDIDPEALKLARFHAESAGISDLIHFQQRDFADLTSQKEYGCIITNPPYGERISDVRKLKALYQSLPGVLSRLPTWSHFVLTNYPDFQKVIQKSANRRRKLYNGRIECVYYQFHGPKKAKSLSDEQNEDPTLSVFGRLDAKAEHQAELFTSRLQKRARHLRRWPTKFGITCYRLYERDIPEIPLVVDRYENCLHIAEFERPSERDLGQQARWLELMAVTAAKTLEIDRRNVFVKSRFQQRGEKQYQKVADSARTLEVTEGGLRFVVNLSDYVDTGLFLDHRKTRQMVRDEVEGKRFLNLFAYTGSFSVYAAAGGALSTTTVDWSKKYQDWARQNMTLNGFDSEKHQFERKSAIDFVHELPERPLYDLAVIDPPTFSNSKRTENKWDVQRDHEELILAVAKRLSPGGTIYFSTNFRRFKLSEKLAEQFSLREITKQTIPDDFRNKRIHRCWKILIPEI